MREYTGKFCPIMVAGGNPSTPSFCIEEECAWWCKFAKDCAIPLLAGMFADSTICQNVFDVAGGDTR